MHQRLVQCLAVEAEGLQFHIGRRSMLKVQYLDDFLFDVMTARLALGMATGNTVAVGGL